MESGYVKFFDTREGKLFGFLVDEMGNELFFHYSDGRSVSQACPSVTSTADIVLNHPTSPLRYPKKGDGLMFVRGRNAKGQKAKTWCYARQYEEMVEKAKRDLTVDEAKQYLADKPCNILEHTSSTNEWGSITTMDVTVVEWLSSDGKYVVAKGEFTLKTVRYSTGGEKTQTENRVIVQAPSPKFSWQTVFLGISVSEFMTIGKPRSVVKGKKQGILWSGGWEEYVVDANSVREMTREEQEKIAGSAFPTLDDGMWLRCLFASNLGNEGQVVKVLRHLGGGE